MKLRRVVPESSKHSSRHTRTAKHGRGRYAVPCAVLLGLFSIGAFAAEHSLERSAPAKARITFAAAEVIALRGSASVIPASSDDTKAAFVGMKLATRDIVQTSSQGRIRLRFADQTVLTLGTNAIFRINRFRYSAKEKTVTSVWTIARGFFRSVTGGLRLRRTARVHTATATLGIRGTEFLGEASAELTQVFVADGAVVVSNVDPEQVGEVELKPGEGTTVGAGASPTPVKRWPQDKVNRFTRLTDID
ncbi:MAG: ferric-dicitrate binding protein FerR (iron transport regulator) [Gammaproteobacteria bacterium]|jgi:ferric-dicitrate binding protein FerR (iron transport regulator)